MNKKDLRGGYCEMQHRHFRTIAAIIRQFPDYGRGPIAFRFANELEKTNPNFDRDRFMAACGLNEEAES